MAVPTKAMEVYSLGTLLVNREEEQTPEGTWRTLRYRVRGPTSKNEQWDEVFPGTLEGRHAAIDFVQAQQSKRSGSGSQSPADRSAPPVAPLSRHTPYSH